MVVYSTVESAKEEVKELEYKIRMMNNPKPKSEEAPAADAAPEATEAPAETPEA